MKCKHVSAKIPDYLQGDLAETEKQQIQTHIESCPKCRKEIADLIKLWNNLGKLPEEKPDEIVRVKFYRMLEAYKQGMQHSPKTNSVRTKLSRIFDGLMPKQPRFQLVFSAAVLLIGLFLGYGLHSVFSNGHQLVKLENEISDLQRTVSLTLMEQESATERLKGVIWSSKTETRDPDIMTALINTLKNDPNVNVRLAAVHALYLYRENPQIQDALLHTLKHEQSPLVQIELIDIISQIREEKALNALKELVERNHLNPEVKKKANSHINQLM